MYVFGGNTLANSFADLWRLELEEGWLEEGGEEGREDWGKGGGLAKWEKVDVVGREVRREGGRGGL